MITVIGLDGSPLTPRAADALAAATLVVGGRRQLAEVAPAPGTAVPGLAGDREAFGETALLTGARRVELGELAPALDALAAHDGDAVVLASGDPGFFGIVRALRSRGLAVSVIPAVSSVALAFARAGLPWDDAVVVSAHGRDPRPALNVCRAHPKVAVLTGPGAGPAGIGAALDGWPRRLVVCEHLGSEAERVTECLPAEAATRPWQDPNVVLVLADRPAATSPGAQAPTSPSVIMSLVWSQQQQCHDHEPMGGARRADTPPEAALNWVWPPTSAPAGGWALAEDAFGSQDAVITKAEVRALALARLAPVPGTLVWDVGAGTGSVAVECARFGAAVIAIERSGERCKLIRQNADRYGVDVRVVRGEAPDALAGLPAPDAVFVGGGGPAVVTAAADARPARIVAALAAIERAGQAHAVLTAAGYPVMGALIQAARLAPLPGDAHRLAGTNPVFLLWAVTPTLPAHGAAP
jgi:precorrin-6B C5,15-methyltransferase / cobalt-precorrin-6B C5,C15-methyltransferase